MQARQLKMISYNVWVDNDYYPQNQADLITFLIESTADIICLQEVTQQFFDLIHANVTLSSSYDYQQPKIVDDSPGAGLLMIKKEYQAQFYPQVHLHKSNRYRYLDYASFTLEGNNIGVASVHLESVFFSKQATDFKVEQLKQVYRKLEAIKPDGILIAGDMNFTGGEQLQLENAEINKLALVDVWKDLHKTSEDETDQSFRDNDVTWDYANNPNIDDEHRDEFHRPDRIFMRLFKPKALQAISMERVVSSMSDHYGLTAVLSLNR